MGRIDLVVIIELNLICSTKDSVNFGATATNPLDYLHATTIASLHQSLLVFTSDVLGRILARKLLGMKGKSAHHDKTRNKGILLA